MVSDFFFYFFFFFSSLLQRTAEDLLSIAGKMCSILLYSVYTCTCIKFNDGLQTYNVWRVAKGFCVTCDGPKISSVMCDGAKISCVMLVWISQRDT